MGRLCLALWERDVDPYLNGLLKALIACSVLATLFYLLALFMISLRGGSLAETSKVTFHGVSFFIGCFFAGIGAIFFILVVINITRYYWDNPLACLTCEELAMVAEQLNLGEGIGAVGHHPMDEPDEPPPPNPASQRQQNLHQARAQPLDPALLEESPTQPRRPSAPTPDSSLPVVST